MHRIAPRHAGLAVRVNGFDGGAGNLWRAAQIGDFAKIGQKIKLAFPIITHRKGVNVMGLHIAALLVLVVFGNDRINIGNGRQ